VAVVPSIRKTPEGGSAYDERVRFRQRAAIVCLCGGISSCRGPRAFEAPPSPAPIRSAPSVGPSERNIPGGLAAFPGAEGFGAAATGGRGGAVIVVRNLNASGPGSLQAALDANGPRTVVFAVSGVIAGVPVLSHNDVTIAGQTSPGGITLRGLLIQGDEVCETPGCPLPRVAPRNFIVRHLRLRPAGIYDANAAGDGLRLHRAKLGILDHLSIGNASDEAVQISLSSDITLQHSLFAETLGDHYEFGGMLLNYSDSARGFPLTRLSIHHNMFVRVFGRVPEISRENIPDREVMDLELSSNVLYGPERPMFLAAGHPETHAPLPIRLNLVGNAVFPNPAVRSRYGLLSIEHGASEQSLSAGSSAFLANNVHVGVPELGDYQLIYCCNDLPVRGREGLPYGAPGVFPSWARPTRHPFPPIAPSLEPRAQLAESVRSVGAHPRDPMDARLLAFPARGAFDPAPVWINPAGDALALGARPMPAPPLDSDGDGMPDEWERRYGLDPHAFDANGMTLSRSLLNMEGYTNLECYLEERARIVSGR
jgi:pectate lyase